MAKRTKEQTTSTASSAALHDPAQDAALAEGRHGRPFDYLGLHSLVSGQDKVTRWVVRVFRPGAAEGALLPEGGDAVELTPACHDVFFAALEDAPGAYRLRFGNGEATWEEDDPYRFGPVLGEMDEHFIGEGSHLGLWHALGAHPMTYEGVEGTHFAVWAPAAERVSIVGAFNDWDGRRHPLRLRGATGVWEIFLPGVGEGAPYKYEIRGADGKLQPLKADPVGFGSEHPPANASIVRDLRGYGWKDEGWLETRAEANRRDQAISIYEVHLPSWRKAEREGGGPGNNGRPLSYKELAEQLVPYVRDMGFTHIEMLPVSEYPFDGSWGYQPIGLYAPTIRHGTPNEFRDFVEACHGAGLGLILDWVPGHFPTDPHGLGRFDGTALYEYADPREGFHQDWNTLIYNYGRREVQNYLIANALYWMKEHHLDGLRVDAVASMLYRDYSRRAGEWLPNVHGGRENLEAIAFLKRMNQVVYGECAGVMTAAEESTSFPAVSRPVHEGGLGFGYKWNMGWMNDTLEYMRHDPVHRRYHHHQMTFGLHYAFSENFILPLSHDEVVHGKGSLLNKMPGNEAEKFANLRAYFAFMWGHPGKKLLFMGQEFAQPQEWNHERSLDWHLLEDGPNAGRHAGMQKLLRDLNNLYRATPALHQFDCEGQGFQWIEANAAEESIFAWARFGGKDTAPVVVACNFTPVERSAYRLGVPAAGHWLERVNSDAADYGGGGRGNLGGVESRPVAAQGRSDSIEITLPPLSTVVFELGK